MKKAFLGLVLAAALFLMAKPILANEGIIQLVGPSESGGSCYAASVYIDGGYKILMTCRGLRMALDPVRNKYIVWANAGEKKQRLGEIVNGKLSASIPDEFETLFVTLEPDAYSSKPSGVVALTGSVETIVFGKGVFELKQADVFAYYPNKQGSILSEGFIGVYRKENGRWKIVAGD